MKKEEKTIPTPFMESNVEKTILTPFADNPALMKAVQDVVEKHFALEEVSNRMTNEMMGQVVRSRIDGLISVRAAFEEIGRHRTLQPVKKTANPAR